MELRDYFLANGWTIKRDDTLAAIPPAFKEPSALPLSSLARQYLETYSDGIYGHQYRAIEACVGGKNVCISTSTASGKSLVFYTCGLELLQRKTNGTVLAIYPLKALTDEQETKWREATDRTGVDIEVGRIDGSVKQRLRRGIMSNASVLIMTPDVVHAWLFSNLHEPAVRDFFAKLQLVVIDEAHTYTGVFGSNSAFLFRRIQRACRRLGSSPRYIAASATIYSPLTHMKNLTGQDFSLIGPDDDTSGHRARRLLVVELPEEGDALTNLTQFMAFITAETDHQFITFVDSRKQTEHLASVMRRTATAEPDTEDCHSDSLAKLNVYPFRAGYESADRKRIQEKLRHRQIRGVISTSALEMGVDIPGLSLGILFGVPNSATSYFQRIGRVGRHRDGTIVVVCDGSIGSNRIARNPELLDHMPLTDGALYLDNPRIQYIHAMCLARPGGELDALDEAEPSIDSLDADGFPSAFVSLCQREYVGEIPTELHTMKAEAGSNPNYAFPLRACEAQYRVETQSRFAPQKNLGSLSFAQVMREAYPGAVYYYQTQPFRVVRLLFRQHTILVRPERRYTTKPVFIPTLIFPNLSSGNVYDTQRYEDMRVVECNLQLKESIIGFKERRGPNEFSVNYPLDAKLGFFFDQAKFDRNYFSSGILITHPVLEQSNVNRGLLAEILFEAFLLQVALERQDIHSGTDRFRISHGALKEGRHFLCVYDQTYGSLRLTNRLMEPATMRGVMEKALDIAENDSAFGVDDENLSAIRDLRSASMNLPITEELSETADLPPENCVQVIAPGSVGLCPDYHNEEFYVDTAIYTPRGLVYRGKRQSQQARRFKPVTVTIPSDRIVPIEGRSELAWYDFETGEITHQAA